jgi:V8-like Glu-specific endopeptidase
LPLEPYRQQLASELYRRLPDLDAAVRTAEAAGVPVSRAPSGPDAADLWQTIVDRAVDDDRVPHLLDAAGAQLDAAAAGALTGAGVMDPASEVGWYHVGPEDLAGYEQRIGERSTLLPVSFLERGLQAARSVCLIRYEVQDRITGRANTATATGFLIDRDKILTCFHVFPDRQAAESAYALFNFEQPRPGVESPGDRFEIAPADGYWTSGSRDHDWTVVAVKGSPGSVYGFLPLAKVEFAGVANVNIVGHPNGEHKQIALYDNLLVRANRERVLYTTETSRGSPGSPVFDTDWRVVALHNGWRKEAQALRFRTVYRNSGVNINRVVDGLTREFVLTRNGR